MPFILGLLKNYKGIASVVGLLVGLGALYGTYQNIKDNWYQQGVVDTQRAYEKEVLELHAQYTTKLETELANYRIAMNENFAAELERAKAERIVEVEIQEVLKYVDREIEVPIACDTVPVKFSSLLNEAINNINSNSPIN